VQSNYVSGSWIPILYTKADYEGLALNQRPLKSTTIRNRNLPATAGNRPPVTVRS
jgi:hypothetical protein